MLLHGSGIYSFYVRDNVTLTSKSADNHFTYPIPHSMDACHRLSYDLRAPHQFVDITHPTRKFDKVKDAPSFVVLFDFSIPRADVSNKNNIYSM